METIKKSWTVTNFIRMSIFAIVYFFIKLYNFYVYVIVKDYQKCKYKGQKWASKRDHE